MRALTFWPLMGTHTATPVQTWAIHITLVQFTSGPMEARGTITLTLWPTLTPIETSLTGGTTVTKVPMEAFLTMADPLAFVVQDAFCIFGALIFAWIWTLIFTSIALKKRCIKELAKEFGKD